MRILFHVTLTTMLRHFESVLIELARRGHTIRIAAPEDRRSPPPPESLVGRERISFVSAPGRRSDEWAHPSRDLRSLRDYMRYLDRPFKNAAKLRRRAVRRMVKTVTHDRQSHMVTKCPKCQVRLVDDEVGQMLFALGEHGLRNVQHLLTMAESTIPSDRGIEAFLRAEDPDVVLVTPLINFASTQNDYVKSAQAIGIPVGFPVFSWDNLSNKGLIHVIPDRVFVWNHRQRAEAAKLHGVPFDRIVLTGAPRFDDFFAMSASVRRADWCQAAGLDPAQPTVMYLCSSDFVAGEETAFVARWIEEVRRAPSLEACNVFIRPHPREWMQWRDFRSPSGVAVGFPQTMNADQSLFDALSHSAAVVGLNTSAQLEAAVVGRPVLTILAPEFVEGQQGTLHFKYLLKYKGGFVDLAQNFDEHRQQLADAVAGRFDAGAIRDFVQRFLRPKGVDRPATDVMVEAFEAFGADFRGRRPAETAVRQA